jgi:hypothetical protein
MRARLRKLLTKWRWERLARKAVRRGIEANHRAPEAEGTPSRAPETPPADDKPD